MGRARSRPALPRAVDALGVAEDELDGIHDEVAAVIDAATEFAKAGAEPGEASLMTEVYADGGSSWRN